MRNCNLKSFYFLIVIFCLSLFAFDFCQAAILYLEPPEGEYHQEDIFIVDIRLNTEEEYINTAEVNLIFPQDTLEVRDFSKGDAILTLWVKEPSFSNQEGRISFSGGIPGGYQGKDGLLGRIIFRAKEKGRAEIQFQETSQLLLNDGFGTSADLKTQGAIFNILERSLEVSRDDWLEETKKDTIPPESFEVEVHQDPELFEGQYFITFSTTDKQTGLDYFEVKEGEGSWERAKSPYLLKGQDFGGIIKVRAVDKAGNERTSQYIRPSKAWLLWIIILVMVVAGILIWIIIKLKPKKQKKTFKPYA